MFVWTSAAATIGKQHAAHGFLEQLQLPMCCCVIPLRVACMLFPQQVMFDVAAACLPTVAAGLLEVCQLLLRTL
jgi:hypothetical protein